MTKYRITIEEIHEDGTVTPFADENGNARNIPEHEGFMLIGCTDIGEAIEGTVVIQNMNAFYLASAMRESDTLRSACRILSACDSLNTIIGDANKEGEDAAN